MRPDAYRGARVAVVGATGFIGAWIARGAMVRGARVALLARDAARAFEMYGALPGVDVLTVDVEDEDRLGRALHEVCPSITFNAVAYGVDPGERVEAEAERLNARLPGVLCDCVARARDTAWPGLGLVHLGTGLEYGRAGGTLDEDTEPKPFTCYGRTKLAGTRAVAERGRELGLPAITARLFTVYGPGEHAGRLLPSLLECARERRPMDLSAGTQERDFTYVEDVAEGVLRLGATKKAAGDVVNLATGRLTSVRRFAELAAEVLDFPPELLRFGVLPVRAEEMQHDPVSIRRLRECTSWIPGTDPAEGIRRTAEWNGRIENGG